MILRDTDDDEPRQRPVITLSHEIHPPRGHMVVEMLPQETKTASGLELPDSAAAEGLVPPQLAKVVRVGLPMLSPNTNEPAPLDYAVGDVLLPRMIPISSWKERDGRELAMLPMAAVAGIHKAYE